jgi:hypothetical protein
MRALDAADDNINLQTAAKVSGQITNSGPEQ